MKEYGTSIQLKYVDGDTAICRAAVQGSTPPVVWSKLADAQRAATGTFNVRVVYSSVLSSGVVAPNNPTLSFWYVLVG